LYAVLPLPELELLLPPELLLELELVSQGIDLRRAPEGEVLARSLNEYRRP
jgi:hypothetical protein